MMEQQRKLAQVQGELQKLDSTLQKDVEVLRGEIQEVCSEITYTEQDFKYKEKQYLDAKSALEALLSRKQAMTEHLHRIINDNEQRKAENLDRIMKKLGLDEDAAAEMFSGFPSGV